MDVMLTKASKYGNYNCFVGINCVAMQQNMCPQDKSIEE